MTARDPGARLVLTNGGTVSPRATAFFASRPAATITDGFDVLVQLVIAAITTEPCRSVSRSWLNSTWTFFGLGSTATATAPSGAFSLAVAPSQSIRSLLAWYGVNC